MPSSTPLSIDPIFHRNADITMNGDANDILDISHKSKFETKNMTVAMTFNVPSLPGTMALVSKDQSNEGDGGFTVWLKDGLIIVTMEGQNDDIWMKVPNLVLAANQDYHFAVSFGKDGLMVWLDGKLMAAEPEFKETLEDNDYDLVIGGTRAWRDDQSDDAHSLLTGTVGDIHVYDKQLETADVIKLTQDADPSLGMQAEMATNMADLMPMFTQLHHASDNLKDIVSDYGVSDHGHVDMDGLTMKNGGKADNTLDGTSGRDAINGRRGDDHINGGKGDDILQGGYGADKLKGGGGADIIAGGHGEDRLFGGGGKDLLISLADAREPDIYPDADRDEGDPYNELTDGKLYPDQPIHADDVLTGGAGADIFYFQTLINAKKRYIEKHTNSDGTINWHGVAGENDKLHDHWVDHLGHDIVTDFSRAEGDRIVIEGHTTEIRSIKYKDKNGDGVMDHSVISLYSDQGNGGGAHNDDRLGTIIVYGDLIKESDIEHTAGPAYGIITTIDDLKEAIKPTDIGKNEVKSFKPKKLVDAKDADLIEGQSYSFVIPGMHKFSSDSKSAMAFTNVANLQMAALTVAFTFKTNDMSHSQALFSKDASGDGKGHTTAWINEDGNLYVRLQTKDGSKYLVAEDIIEKGETYDFALSLGDDGARLYVNGVKVAYEFDYKHSWAGNEEGLVIGGTGWSSDPGTVETIHNRFNGKITDFVVYDDQVSDDKIKGTEERDGFVYFDKDASEVDILTSDGKLNVDGQNVRSATTHLSFDDVTVAISDIQIGSNKADDLEGGHAADILIGRSGADTLDGNSNDDHLWGLSGEDRLYGDSGRDYLAGGGGDDYLSGGAQKDKLYGGAGHDELKGDAGADHFYGGIGDDYIYGNSWGEEGTSNGDTAFYMGNFANYTFEADSFYHSGRGETVTRLIITDKASGGLDGLYEGRDVLMDIDELVFADQTVSVDSLL